MFKVMQSVDGLKIMVVMEDVEDLCLVGNIMKDMWNLNVVYIVLYFG